jgi:hypothetical protein
MHVQSTLEFVDVSEFDVERTLNLGVGTVLRKYLRSRKATADRQAALGPSVCDGGVRRNRNRMVASPPSNPRPCLT